MIDIQISMGHEIMADWLVSEIQQPSVIAELLQAIDAILASSTNEFTRLYPTYLLQMDRDDVVVRALTDDDEYELEDDLHIDDDAMIAECGLDDFKDMMMSWQNFVATT